MVSLRVIILAAAFATVSAINAYQRTASDLFPELLHVQTAIAGLDYAVEELSSISDLTAAVAAMNDQYDNLIESLQKAIADLEHAPTITDDEFSQAHPELDSVYGLIQVLVADLVEQKPVLNSVPGFSQTAPQLFDNLETNTINYLQILLSVTPPDKKVYFTEGYIPNAKNEFDILRKEFF